MIVAAAGIALALLYSSNRGTASAEAVMSWFADRRTPTSVNIAEVFHWLTSVGVIMTLRLGTVIVLAVFKRFRVLIVFLGVFVVDAITNVLIGVELPPPEVKVLVDETSWWFPSRPVAALGVTLFAMGFVLLPRGRVRAWYEALAAGLVALVLLSEALLGAEYFFPSVYAAVLAFSTAALMFPMFAPEDSFPISYRRGGNAAHLDLGGTRGEAIVVAMRDQLGMAVIDVKPFGLEGSGGSSPLLMTLENGSHLFGKIFSTSHVRADRWYRIGRTLMYGKLEDEAPFGSVRRLVTYEDYALRLLRDEGIRVAKPYGVVELTPNREYMLVQEFFENSTSMGKAEVDDAITDEGMDLVRRLWDAGLAHRDLKPANMLVKDQHLQLVDVSGLEVRPSPWRQAVDLANMMLVMALSTDADRVYMRATRVFTPDDVAEAVASAQGMAIPTELSAKMKQDGRPLLERLRELAPPHPPVSIQRWSLRRIGLMALVVLGLILLALLFVDSLQAGLSF